MSSGQVPLWVPIVVGLLGLAGVLSAQLVAGWREDRRWRRETEREELRWERERQRDQDTRGYEGRSRAYAEVIGAIEAFDWALFHARKVLAAGGDLPEDQITELRGVTSQARNALGGVNVYAPERIRAMLRESMLRRSSLAIALMANRSGDDEQLLWREGLREYRVMRAAMRRDLGLDAEEEDS
jgi:hypothetical protein